MLSYRSNPHSGGQGVYVKNLSRALRDLGHAVDVVAGPPDPGLAVGVRLIALPCLDLYNPADPFRVPSARELSDPVNLLEWIGVSTMGFPEPFTFGLRAWRYLKRRLAGYDVLHDNQSLSYGIWALSRRRRQWRRSTTRSPWTGAGRCAPKPASGESCSSGGGTPASGCRSAW